MQRYWPTFIFLNSPQLVSLKEGVSDFSAGSGQHLASPEAVSQQHPVFHHATGRIDSWKLVSLELSLPVRQLHSCPLVSCLRERAVAGARYNWGLGVRILLQGELCTAFRAVWVRVTWQM
jgi:hypothetical protein